MDIATLESAFQAAGLPYRPPEPGEHWLGCAIGQDEGPPVKVSTLWTEGVLRVTAHELGKPASLWEGLAAANAATLDWMVGSVWLADADGGLEASAAVPLALPIRPVLLRAVVLHVADAGAQIRAGRPPGYAWPGEIDFDGVATTLRKLGHAVVELSVGGVGVARDDEHGRYFTEFLPVQPGLLLVRARRPETPWAADAGRAMYRCGQASRRFAWGSFVRDTSSPVAYHLAALPAAWAPPDEARVAWMMEKARVAAGWLGRALE